MDDEDSTFTPFLVGDDEDHMCHGQNKWLFRVKRDGHPPKGCGCLTLEPGLEFREVQGGQVLAERAIEGPEACGWGGGMLGSLFLPGSLRIGFSCRGKTICGLNMSGEWETLERRGSLAPRI